MGSFVKKTTNGNKVIMVICDYFTKWTEAHALPNHEAYTVADMFVTSCICRFRVLHQIHTDQGQVLNLDYSRSCANYCT